MSVFAKDGDLLVPTPHARGPWDPQAMHGGAPAALVVRAAEAAAPGMRVARLTMDFLGAVPMRPVRVDARVAKPGKRFQVVEVAIEVDGRDVVWARVNVVRVEETPGLPAPVRGDVLGPPPDAAPRNQRLAGGGEGFGPTAMDIRFVEGDFDEDGVAKAWFRLDRPIVEGEEPSPAQLAVAAGDFGNGISRIVSWDDWLFVNTELTVHLNRDPVGEWVGLDARSVLEDNGSGLAISTLYDLAGPIGRAAQALFVARR